MILHTTGGTEKVQLSSVVETPSLPARPAPVQTSPGKARHSRGKELVEVVLLSLVLCSIGNHVLARWLGISRSAPWRRADAVYRRVGPLTGPQVYCAGSSLLVAGLDWPEVSQSLGKGIENWTVAGSSPEIWEIFQQQNRVSDTTIIGVSVYDLNEMRLTPERASYVPSTVTGADLWSSHASTDLRERILAQYALSYVRVLFPLAGDADKVLVGMRSEGAKLLGKETSLEQHEAVVVEKEGALEVEDSTDVSKWDSGHVLRRLEVLKAENHDAHQFSNGPKNRAFRRLLVRAQQQGRVIVVVLPVSQYYVDTFLDKGTVSAFEKSLAENMAAVLGATLVRLDQVPGIFDNKNFLDLVHLNSSGRRVLTPVFLRTVNEATSQAKLRSSFESALNPNGITNDQQLH